MTRIGRKILWLMVFIGFIAALVVFFAVATSGFKNWNGNEWFDHWGKGKPVTTTVSNDKDKPVAQSALLLNNPRAVNSTTGRVLIKTQSQNASKWNPNMLKLHGKTLFDGAPSGYDDFEYILGIDLHSNIAYFDDFRFYLSGPSVDYDFFMELSDGNRLLCIGPTPDGPTAPPYPVEETWSPTQMDYAVFVTITSNRLFVSCVPAGEGLPTYKNSLDFILWDSADSDNANLIDLNALKRNFWGSNPYFGYSASPSDNYDDEFVASAVTETFNFYMDMEIPEKEGYTFTGWYYDEACTRPYQGEPITQDTNLYAGFEINKYTVTFDLREIADTDDPNAGDTYFHTIEVEHGQVASYTPAAVTGKTFLGWFTVDGTKYENTPIKQDTELIGRWTNIRYTITFNVNGGDNEIAPITVEHGTVAELPVPERTGFEFLGWVCINNSDFETSFPVTSDLDLKAEWKRNVFTVTFYVDNTVFKTIQVEYGQTLGSATSDSGISPALVVGFENVNTTTAAATLNEFEVVDDVAVYLSEAPVIPDEPSDSAVKTQMNKVVKFLKDNWILITCCAVGGIIFVWLLVMAFKRKRR